MKKFLRIFGIIFLLVLSLMPVTALAEREEDEPPVKVESFVINSEEDEIYNATMQVSVDQSVAESVDYKYTISLVTDISQDGKELAHGRGTTGEDVTFDIDMRRVNTYADYRFKIYIEYDIDGEEGFTYGYSMVFEYTQESFSEDLRGRDITVDVSGMVIDIDWSSYRNGGDLVVLTIDVDGTVDFEEVLPINDKHYEYFYNKDATVVTITLRQVDDGLISEGITDVINLKEKAADEFYLEFPEETNQFDVVWNVKYFNADKNTVKWVHDSGRNEKELNGTGSFNIEMKEDNQALLVEYMDENEVKWLYNFSTDLAVYAPTISLLEPYDGSKVSASHLVLAGKLDDKNAEVVVSNGEVKKYDDGSFLIDVDLNDGKNIIEISATNKLGKSSKTTVTIYKEGESKTTTVNVGFLKKYMPLCITLGVAIVLIVIMVIVTKGKKDDGEKANKKADKKKSKKAKQDNVNVQNINNQN